MKTFSRILTFFLAVGVFAVTVGFSGPSAAQSPSPAQSKNDCKPFPKVPWWGKMSHERVTRYVDKKYDGDWKRYLAKWERQLKIMVDIYDRGSTAVIKKRDIKLKGDKLGEYIANIIKRISVTRCLAGETTGTNREPSSISKPGNG